MSRKTSIFCAICLAVVGIATTAQAKTTRRVTMILDFNTCVPDPTNANVLNCVEKDDTGKPIGQFRVTYLNAIGDDGTCGVNPGCAMSWHEGYFYALEGGTITVATATAWQEQAHVTGDGAAPILGFSSGAATGTGRYAAISGNLTMRWNDDVCICSFDIVGP